MTVVKISMKKKDFTIPFDKVTIIDCDGNRQIIEAKEIIIESNDVRFHIENINHPVFPNGITVSCSRDEKEKPEYLAIYPAAANVVTLVINHG